MIAQETTKVFHSARQDIEVLQRFCGVIPHPVFDTQIAAAMLGIGDQVGYATLVEKVVGKKLAKAHTRTDWCQRPLTPAQIDYACDDVRYLGTLRDFLCEELDKQGRMQWVQEECEALTHPDLYDDAPDNAYQRITNGHKMDPVSQGILKKLATWREQTSQSRDLPRNWVIRDAGLAEISRARPGSIGDLAELEGLPSSFVRRYGTAVVDLVQAVVNETCHPVIWGSSSPLDPGQRAQLKKMINHLRQISEETGISMGLLGSRQEVESLLRGKRDVSLLKGWRGRLVGTELAAMLV